MHQHPKLINLKHGWPTKESDESSEFDEEMTEAQMMQDVKLQYAAQQALRHQRAKAARQARTGQLIKQAQLVLQRGRGQRRLAPPRRQKARRGKPHLPGSSGVEKHSSGQKAGKPSPDRGESVDTGQTSQDNPEVESDGNVAGTSSDQTPAPPNNTKPEQPEVYDCTEYLEQVRSQRRLHQRIQGEYIDDILSPDDGSCNSSRLSAKSDKNMADFEGEEGLSDEELAQINAHVHYNSQMQQQLASMASLYQGHIPHAVLHHRPPQKETVVVTSCDFSLDEVCQPGITLLWDLVQDDKAHLLPDGLAVEAEKALCTLVCFSTERRIKMKFIEACIQNVANNRSVAVSLRLLPKIFSSFQQYRSGLDTHTVTMWAEKEFSMMHHFFDNLLHYTNAIKNGTIPSGALYSHVEEIQVRLLFLTCVFSSIGSPENFRLSLDQVDTLWTCLATDPECSDECLSWFLNQAKSKDHHAMGPETFKHIFLEKMPKLCPESMSMIGLNLFQQLCHRARLANASLEKPLSEDQICGMDQLWGVALRAHNNDVSMTAIQFLNAYYINCSYESCLYLDGRGSLEKEEEFVQRCMNSLGTALQNVQKNCDSNLLVIQRGLVLLKNHLEAFRKRYAFHLRTWQIDGQGIISHQRNLQDRQSTPIRVLLQPAGIAEKSTLEMYASDLITELRAEVARWWEALQIQQQQQRQAASHSGSMLSPILGAMLGDGPIRMITQGQELTVDMDEKTLGEMQFKDMQLVLVSVGASRPPRKMDGTIPSSFLPPPDRDKLPMMLLLQEPHFEQLLTLMEDLSNLQFSEKIMESQDLYSVQTKARVLSRKVWELLMLLPTSVSIHEGLKSILNQEPPASGDNATPVNWSRLLDPHSPHRLMYSLQIVEALSRSPKHRRRSLLRSGAGDALISTDSEMSVDTGDAPEELWSKQFIAKGGLSHMFHIFVSGSLQSKEGEFWNQWNQECLAYLLRLISQFAVEQSDVEAGHDDVFETCESPRKKMKSKKSSLEKIVIPRLTQTILSMMNVDKVLKILMQILYDAAVPSESNQLHAGSWGRAEVVHYSLSFLVSWAHSSAEARTALCSAPNFSSWLMRLILEAPEPYVRREACMGLYRLCLGRTGDNKSGYSLLLPVLASLLQFLPSALLLKPQRTEQLDSPKEKEPYGPGCRDYFWLVARFVESVSKEDAEQGSESPVDMNDLAKSLADHIIQRPYYETRHGYEEDDGLIGLLNLCTGVMKHNPEFKTSTEGQEFLQQLFWALFDLASPSKRYLPKCKSQTSRSAAYDLLVEMVKGSVENYTLLHAKLLRQHTKDVHAPYPWDYWPHEDGRSKCGYVGLTNLGATCYMATCMQHLYMIPQARQSVLQAKCSDHMKHEGTLVELQKMFAYLMESERKAYNPKSFCKAYTMDKQPLNTGEQKDMTEFFTDLISKLEEMSQELKLVKSQFGGILTNNVVSLDCPHVSRTLEEFYTVRCQVTDMKNLYESLDEVTVKDMLEGDNMYTCSKCQKKVRAEKRACFKKLPKILCFNTMRYTFNMVTMMKEKVNTHFSFPLRLDMSQYLESHLMGPDKLKDNDDDDSSLAGLEDYETEQDDSSEYELIGVTVHTGTADGGHYYSFIRDRINRAENGLDKWYLFNDAEVKPFDSNQIASECFGGEMTSKTYDSVTDKFMDFSFEKTNSAYMLFYERIPSGAREKEVEKEESKPVHKFCFELSKELADWIWQDNMQFLQDKNIFEHTYFAFMLNICGYIPPTLPKDDYQQISLMASQLSTSFVLETLIHAKEKPTMLQWIELLTKQFNSCPGACEWFLDHMAEDDWWPQQILIKCPNQVVRQMFQRLLIHVIKQLKPAHVELYLLPMIEGDDGGVDVAELDSKTCVTRFVKKMLSILEHGVRPHSKYLTEYFAFLLDFSKMGDEESLFMIHINAISTMINFYMGQKSQENYVEILSDDDEEEEEVVAVSEDKYRPLSLEKMITLIAHLVEKSRGDDRQLHLSEKDYNNIIGGKGFFFLFNQIRDNINVRQTCNLIFGLCRWNDSLAEAVVQMIFNAVKKLNPEQTQSFFKLLTMLVEFVGGPPGMPPFTQFILQRFWELTEYSPQQCLEWLSAQVTRNKLAHTWVLQHMDDWVETYLMANNNVRVRNAAAYLLVSLVPSSHFRQAFRSARSILSPHKEHSMPPESVSILHKVYEHLLSLLPLARLYVDPQVHGTTKLMCFFALLTYCLVSKAEKLMFGSYFLELWQLFQPKLSEPQISMHHNKQALLMFWHQVCVDCPENIKLMVTNAHVCKNIAFNYILADHDDQEVVLFNRCMLPAYYGLLRMCCQQSRPFTRQLAQHQNIQWAFKNISPYPAQYTAAVDELFKMMKLMSARYPDSGEEELRAINTFRRNTIVMYLQNLDARSNWQTLVNAFKILVDSTEDRLLIIYQQGLQMITEAFYTLHVMYHEATACHVTADIVDLLSILLPVLKVARHYLEKKGVTASAEVKNCLLTWKERMDFVKKLLTLLNSYTPYEIRDICMNVLKEMVMTFQSDCLQTMVPILTQAHLAFQDSNLPVAMGPYFPRRGQKPIGSKSNIRPPRPQFQMLLHSSQLEASRGIDDMYDTALWEYYASYHTLVDLLCRIAVNQQNLNRDVINLSAMVAFEGVPLHSPYFAKLWCEIYHSEQVDKECIKTLCNSSYFIDYVDAVLLDERLSLNNHIIYQFFCSYFPKVHQQVLNDQGRSLLDSLIASVTAEKSALENVKSDKEFMTVAHRINGDLRAMLLIFSVQPPKQLSGLLVDSLQFILGVCRSQQQQKTEALIKQRHESGDRQSDLDDGELEATPSKRRKISSECEEKAELKPTADDRNPEGGENGKIEESGKSVDAEEMKETEKDKSEDEREKKSEDKAETSKTDTDGEKEGKEKTGNGAENNFEKIEDKQETDNKHQASDEEKDNTRLDASPKPPGSKDASDSGDSDTVKSSAGTPSSTPSSLRSQHKEKPSWVDLVVRHIESLFNLISKK
ncbi:ubiquitin carboxyl-terminal hydrolase 34-like isoform X2 [Liolophura sinensis]|uniref:ubiquitin carboxyl-terminal hydrolase 34-like isoform X2 n=1 Tax=Liolophura sinensis TaxID=3198878 RepID=UPI00315877E7